MDTRENIFSYESFLKRAVVESIFSKKPIKTNVKDSNAMKAFYRTESLDLKGEKGYKNLLSVCDEDLDNIYESDPGQDISTLRKKINDYEFCGNESYKVSNLVDITMKDSDKGITLKRKPKSEYLITFLKKKANPSIKIGDSFSIHVIDDLKDLAEYNLSPPIENKIAPPVEKPKEDSNGQYQLF